MNTTSIVLESTIPTFNIEKIAEDNIVDIPKLKEDSIFTDYNVFKNVCYLQATSTFMNE